MCKTRWVQRHNALNIFVNLFQSIACSMEDISTHPREWNPDSVNDARSYLMAITSFEFIAALHTTKSILSYIEPISISLQGNSQDVINAIVQVQDVIHALQEKRDNVDQFHAELYRSMIETADEVNIEPHAPRIVQRQRHRGNVPALTPEEYFKRNATIPILDEILVALHDRFGPDQRAYAQAFHLIPNVIQSTDRQTCEQAILAFSATHRADLPGADNILAEIHIWINRWSARDVENAPSTAASALKEIDKAFFPNLFVLMKLLCTVGVTSCECERSISALRRLETYLRTTMSQERLDGLALMHVHYGIEIDVDWVTNEFARKQPRRLQLVDILAN